MSKFLPQEKLQTLSQAYDFANKLTDLTNDPRVVLGKAGITIQHINQARQLLNNPMAGLILGESKQKILEGLNKAESFLSGNNSLTEQSPVNELEQLQKSLATLK